MEKKISHFTTLTVVLAILVAILAFSVSNLSSKVKTLESTVSEMQTTIAKMQETSSETRMNDIEQHLTALDNMVIDHISEKYQATEDSRTDNQDFAVDEELLYDVPGYSSDKCCGDGLEHIISQYNEREIAYALNTVGTFSAYCQEHDFTVEIKPYYCD